MKLLYTDRLIKEVLETQCFPKMAEEECTPMPNHQIFAVITHYDASKWQKGCLVAINSTGILLVLMNSWDVQKSEGHVFYPFSEMQGVKIKNGILNVHMTLQLKEGTRYKLQISKHSTRRLPNQRDNLSYIIQTLESKGLNQMKNEIHRNRVKAERKSSFIYMGTLIAMLIIPFSQIGKIHDRNFFLFICIATVIVHAILYIFIGSLFNCERKFTREYNKLIKQFERQENNEDLYNRLIHITHQPKTDKMKDVYYLKLLTLALELEKYEDGMLYVGKIQNQQKNGLLETVTEQRKSTEQQYE